MYEHKNYFENHPVCRKSEIDWDCRIGFYRFHDIAKAMSTEERKAILAKVGLYFVRLSESTFAPPAWYLANKATYEYIKANHVCCFSDEKHGYNAFPGLVDFYICPAVAADAHIAGYLRNNA